MEKDIDEFGLGLEAAVGAAIDVGFAEAGIEGGVRANIGMNWNDLDGDGKIYLDELVDLFLLQPTPAPAVAVPGMCVFDARGSIDAFIRAYYDVFLFGGDSFTIANINLFQFSHACTAPGLAELTSGRSDFEDGTLLLYAGDYAEPRGTLYGDSPNEEFTINQTLDGSEPVINVVFHYLNRDGDPATTTRTFKGVERIFFSGGSGNDKITVDASVTVPVQMFGGAGNDILIGGSGPDVLAGGIGNDVLNGGLGNDRYVFANSWGVDSIIEPVGGGAQDTFDFSSVTSTLAIGAGILSVTSGSHSVNGGTDSSGAITPVQGIERILSGSGLDTLTASTVLGGGSVNVWSITGANKGSINGVLHFEGVENLTGGAQEDRFVMTAAASLTGVVNGAAGNDTLDYSGFDQSVTVNRQAKTANNISRFENIEAAVGSSSADQLIGRNVNAIWTLQGIIQGNILDSGVSTPFTFSNFENLTGGNNNDEFVIQPGGRLTGNLLGTVTTGVSDSDKVNLASHATALRVNLTGVNSGNVQAASTLVTFSSIENAQTGDGDDTFAVSHLAGLTGQTDGGPGARDTVDYSNWNTSVSINLFNGSNQMGTIAGVEDLIGGSAADTLTGNDLDNRIIGRGGADTIVGRNGNDVLIGDSAQITTLSGVITSIRLTTSGEGNDSITAGNGNNIVLGGLGNDTITTGNGNNVVAGDLVLLTLSGGVVTSIQTLNSASDGNDIINLGSGNDSVVAGAGTDSIQDSGGRNVIIETVEPSSSSMVCRSEHAVASRY